MQVPSVLKWSLCLVLLCGSVSAPAFAQSEQTASARKVVNKVTPNYPSLARNMNLSGSVKLEALVLPNGTVKTIQIKGGNPLLAQAAESAVRAWKWEKADHETTEVLEIRFTP